MRIISGKYKGRVLKGFDIVGTRPTMDRVKESLFAMIQEDIPGSVCLDLFAGSGNLGLEALSNGAQECYFVDHNKIAIKTILENCKVLKIGEEAHIVPMDYQKALLSFFEQHITFDLIFLDPPYQEKLISSVLELIAKYQLLKPSGKIICEYENEKVETDLYFSIKDRKYGSKYIKILKK